jgi:DNA-binding Xre family transcriptional regulator
MIYFLQRPDGTIKIGSTGNLETRLNQIAILHRGIQLLGVMEGGRAEESTLHRQFAALRVSEGNEREWFRPESALTDFIRDHADTSVVVHLKHRTVAAPKLKTHFPALVAQKQLHDGRHYTGKEIAEATNTSSSTISRLMGGNAEQLSMKTLEVLCRWLDCDVRDIVYLEREAS